VIVRNRALVVVATLCVACSPMRGCVESQFTLAPESQAPKWMTPPVGSTRSSLTVELTYYSPLFPVDDTVLKLKDLKGKTFSEVTGRNCWHPVMQGKRNQYGGFDPDSYPHFVYLRIGSVTEVLEFKRGPTFWVVDDPVLEKQASESQECDRG